MKILVLTSTFQSMTEQKIPLFVYDQITTLANRDRANKYVVLAPYDHDLQPKNNTVLPNLSAHYFRYMRPSALCKLNSQGLWPTIKENPEKILLVPFMLFFFIFRARQLAINEKPDLIYAHWFTPQAIVAYTVSVLTGTPYAFTSHASDVKILQKLPIIGKILVKLCTHRARRISVVSKRTKTKLQCFFSESGWSKIEKKVDTIPMGTSMPKAKSEPKSEGTPYILFIGRLAEKKGLSYLIQGFKVFSEQHRNYNLKIAGTGPLEGELRSLISSLSLENKVDLLGHVDGADKETLLHDCHIFIVPSIITDSGDAEGLPVALIEGLSAGKICIATRESGADEVISHQYNGFLIDQKCARSISTSLSDAANLDAESIKYITENALIAAQNYSWDVIGTRYQVFLEKAAHANQYSYN